MDIKPITYEDLVEKTLEQHKERIKERIERWLFGERNKRNAAAGFDTSNSGRGQ